MAPRKETPSDMKPAKRPVFYVEIHQPLFSYVYVEADTPEAAEQMVWDEGPKHDWWNDRNEWDECEIVCFGDMDEEPDLVAEKTEDCDAVSANPEVIEGIVSSMVPIPGKEYLMGRFPVTQAQWKAVMGWNPSKCKGADRPVENVSWVNSRNFLLKLNDLPVVKEAGLAFRLPTLEEWNFACRAGATGDYCKLADGTEITEETLGEVAWFGDNSGDETHPVGQKKPNAFGLYDMHGNVWEWTNTAWTNTALGVQRFVRGGSWDGSAWSCESSNRLRDWPDRRYCDLGFRLCASGRAESNDGSASRK